jgi:hypothetical protein
MPSLMSTIGVTQPILTIVVFHTSDGVLPKSLVPAQAGPYRVTGILVTSTDTSDQNLDLLLNVGGGAQSVGSIHVPAQQGLAGTPPVDGFAGIFPSSINGIDLPAAGTISGAMETTVTASLAIVVMVLGGLY